MSYYIQVNKESDISLHEHYFHISDPIRVVLDIDDTEHEYLRYDIEEIKNIFRGIASSQGKEFLCSEIIYRNDSKKSARMYTNIAMKREQIKEFLTSYKSIDSAIYSNTCRLRVPLSYKYIHNENTLLKNFHKVPSSWNLEDCFIQNVSSCIQIYNPLISKHPYFAAPIYKKIHFSKIEFSDPEGKIREVFGIAENVQIKKVHTSEYGNTFYKISGSYNCIYCEKKHDNKQIVISRTGAIKCSYFPNTMEPIRIQTNDKNDEENKEEKKEELPFLERILSTPRIKVNFQSDIVVNQKYLSLEYSPFMDGKNIFIKSLPGTGKSTTMMKWISLWGDKKILYVSMRVSFSQNLLNSMKKKGLQFELYSDISGDIDPASHP